jgi:hypothetical protein
VISFIPKLRSEQLRNFDRHNFGMAINLPRNPQHQLELVGTESETKGRAVPGTPDLEMSAEAAMILDQ